MDGGDGRSRTALPAPPGGPLHPRTPCPCREHGMDGLSLERPLRGLVDLGMGFPGSLAAGKASAHPAGLGDEACAAPPASDRIAFPVACPAPGRCLGRCRLQERVFLQSQGEIRRPHCREPRICNPQQQWHALARARYPWEYLHLLLRRLLYRESVPRPCLQS